MVTRGRTKRVKGLITERQIERAKKRQKQRRKKFPQYFDKATGEVVNPRGDRVPLRRKLSTGAYKDGARVSVRDRLGDVIPASRPDSVQEPRRARTTKAGIPFIYEISRTETLNLPGPDHTAEITRRFAYTSTRNQRRDMHASGVFSVPYTASRGNRSYLDVDVGTGVSVHSVLDRTVTITPRADASGNFLISEDSPFLFFSSYSAIYNVFTGAGTTPIAQEGRTSRRWRSTLNSFSSSSNNYFFNDRRFGTSLPPGYDRDPPFLIPYEYDGVVSRFAYSYSTSSIPLYYFESAIEEPATYVSASKRYDFFRIRKVHRPVLTTDRTYSPDEEVLVVGSGFVTGSFSSFIDPGFDPGTGYTDIYFYVAGDSDNASLNLYPGTNPTDARDWRRFIQDSTGTEQPASNCGSGRSQFENLFNSIIYRVSSSQLESLRSAPEEIDIERLSAIDDGTNCSIVLQGSPQQALLNQIAVDNDNDALRVVAAAPIL